MESIEIVFKKSRTRKDMLGVRVGCKGNQSGKDTEPLRWLTAITRQELSEEIIKTPSPTPVLPHLSACQAPHPLLPFQGTRGCYASALALLLPGLHNTQISDSDYGRRCLSAKPCFVLSLPCSTAQLGAGVRVGALPLFPVLFHFFGDPRDSTIITDRITKLSTVS